MAKISDAIDPHSLSTTVLRCYWALDHLETVDKNRFSLTEIRHCLIEEVGISVTLEAVRKALSRAGRGVNRNNSGYRLMEAARKELVAAQSDETIFIESGQPFSAKRVQLGKIFKGMKGTIRICDPYVDPSTLDLIFSLLERKQSVRILTQKIIDKPVGTMKRVLADLIKEGFSVEIREYSASGIHDRYILDDSSMWLSGNSLNHLGDKESFIVKIGEDIRQSTCSLFDSRWKTSTVF